MATLSQVAAQASFIAHCHHGFLASASRVVGLNGAVRGGAKIQPAGVFLRSFEAEKRFHLERRLSQPRRRVRASAADGEEPPALSEDEMDPPSDVNVSPEEEAEIAVSIAAAASGADSYSSSSGFSADTGSDLADLKQALIDSLYGTERGLRASGETRGEVVELISQLEAKNPTPSPTDAVDLLDGKWVLAYTSFSELFPLLAAGNLPLVTVGEISQTIDAVTSRVENRVTFSSPLASTSFGASASFEVRSPKRVQVKFEETVINPPQLPEVPELPSEIEVFGQRVALADLGPLQSALAPLQEAATSALKTLSEQSPLKIPIPGNSKAESWLLTTYLDEDLRISRGDGNSVFVLVKEGSLLLD